MCGLAGGESARVRTGGVLLTAIREVRRWASHRQRQPGRGPAAVNGSGARRSRKGNRGDSQQMGARTSTREKRGAHLDSLWSRRRSVELCPRASAAARVEDDDDDGLVRRCGGLGLMAMARGAHGGVEAMGEKNREM